MKAPRGCATLVHLIFMGPALATLGGCSRSEIEPAAQAPSAASQAKALRSSLSAAELANRRGTNAKSDDSMEMGGATAGESPPGGPLPAAPPATAGAPVPTAPAAVGPLLGQPPSKPSGLFRVGATEFFLNQAAALDLTVEQRERLAALKARWLVSNSTSQRKIDQAEQDLWVLTSDEAPDAAMIGAKINASALLTAEQRMDFIRAQSEATAVLTDAQRRAAVAPVGSVPPPGSMPPPGKEGM